MLVKQDKRKSGNLENRFSPPRVDVLPEWIVPPIAVKTIQMRGELKMKM